MSLYSTVNQLLLSFINPDKTDAFQDGFKEYPCAGAPLKS